MQRDQFYQKLHYSICLIDQNNKVLHITFKRPLYVFSIFFKKGHLEEYQMMVI